MIPVNNVGAIGFIPDQPLSELPLNAWSAGKNVRFRDGAVEKFSGHVEVYATPTWAPYWLMPVPFGSAYYWLYAGASKVGATDGSTHADITRAAGGDYTTDLNVGWTGDIIERVPVMTNGADAPQMWNGVSLATKLTPLTAWPVNYTTRSMRALKRYLVALDITKATGTRYPNMIKWSDAAPSGAVPASWDETSTTNDAGEWTLSDKGGFLIDSIPLRDDLVLYKEQETWRMYYVGGIDVFRFERKFASLGMLARKCAVEFFSGKHVVFAGDDIVQHDGQQAQSLLTRRLRTALSSTIDSTYYQRSFVAVNYASKEVWTCIPETGQSTATRAFVWNWVEGTMSIRDLPNAAFIEAGIVNPVNAEETWAGAIGTWATDTSAWGDRSYDPAQRKMLMAIPGTTKLYTPDNTQQFDGNNATAYVERQQLGFPLKADSPPDYTTEKRLRGLWPRITGTAGGIINIYVGTHERVDGPVTWQAAFPFTIGSTEYVDTIGDLPDAKLHALKFESTSNISWRLNGYDADVVPAGMHGSR